MDDPATVVVGCTPKASLFAPAAVTVNVPDVAPDNAPSAALSVLRVPAVVGWIALNVATPFTAATVSVLVPVNPVLPLLIVTLLLFPVTVFPYWSCTSTVTAGVIDVPATVVVGCTPKASLFATPLVTVNVPDAAPVSAPSAALSVLSVPAVVGWIALNVATPFTAATVSVLVPVNPVLALLIVTLLLSVVTVFPY
jgi:hypothetical protein